MDEYETDMKEIDRVTRALYSSICLEEGGKPALDRLRNLFIPEGRLINNNGDTPVMMSIDRFIDTINWQLSSGSLSSFYEAEISSRTELFGKIAHRFSTYEATFHLDGSEQSAIGINSIQMMKKNPSWFVTSLVWNDQTEHRTIPAKYLQPSNGTKAQ
jgi:hypothetical protein